MPSLSKQFLFCCVLMIGCALLAQPAGAAGMCRADEVWINCGQGPQCAEKPAVCCAGKTCGGGMVCAQTARGPECGVPNITRCGQYICGEGMICVQTPRGKECGIAGTQNGSPGGAMPSGSFLKNCMGPPSGKSRSQCICIFNAMNAAGLSSDEIYVAALFMAGRQSEVQDRVRAWGGESRFLDRLSRVDDSGCN